MRHGFIIVLVATLFAACNNKNKGTDTTDNTSTTTTTTTTAPTTTAWPDSTRQAFIADCIANSKNNMSDEKAREVCNCMQGKIETQYPNYADAATLNMQQINEMAKDCVQ
jgi:hypothetical protein